MNDDFQKPDMVSPLDLENYLSQASKTAMVRGLFHQMLVNEVKAKTGKSLGRGNYIGLKYYPISELARLDVEVALLLYPNMAQREAIRLLGFNSYKAFIESSTFAKVTFSLINNPSTLMSSLGKLSSFILNEGSIATLLINDNQAILQFRGWWVLECATIGSIEGLFTHLNKKCEILTRTHAPGDFDMQLSWTDGL
jgi:uncharacterized protein (TIGR02265 family)